jgi:hypothetical protein
MSTANVLLDFHEVQKESDSQPASSLNLPLEELVFLCHKYFSIVLLQQDASALWNTVVINNNGILIHISKVQSCEKGAREKYLLEVHICDPSSNRQRVEMT